jgi:predicted O-methyltransferase YrrM
VDLAKDFWSKSEHGKKITSKLGSGLDIIPTLGGQFDFVFIDADKRNYIDYLKLVASCENICTVDNVTEAQIESLLDRLAKNYDGYCFDEFYKKKVFNTWSVNSFFQSIFCF